VSPSYLRRKPDRGTSVVSRNHRYQDVEPRTKYTTIIGSCCIRRVVYESFHQQAFRRPTIPPLNAVPKDNALMKIAFDHQATLNLRRQAFSFSSLTVHAKVHAFPVLPTRRPQSVNPLNLLLLFARCRIRDRNRYGIFRVCCDAISQLPSKSALTMSTYRFQTS
jgi:hypothetical protein